MKQSGKFLVIVDLSKHKSEFGIRLKPTLRPYDPVTLLESESTMLVNTEYHELYAFDMKNFMKVFTDLHTRLYFSDLYVGSEDYSSLRSIYDMFLKFLSDPQHNRKFIYIVNIRGSIEDTEVVPYFERVMKEFLAAEREAEKENVIHRISTMVYESLCNYVTKVYQDQPMIVSLNDNTIDFQVSSGSYRLNILKVK